MNNKYYEVVETCPHCDAENIYSNWDVNKMGFVATCNECGKQIMLCDECVHHEDNLNKNYSGCDWCKTECGGKCFRGTTTN